MLAVSHRVLAAAKHSEPLRTLPAARWAGAAQSGGPLTLIVSPAASWQDAAPSRKDLRLRGSLQECCTQPVHDLLLPKCSGR